MPYIQGRQLYIPVGALSMLGHQPHAAAWPVLREILVVLMVIVVVIALLVIPILAGAIFDSASKGAEKAAPAAFCVGLGVLLIGLVFRAPVLDIAGGGLMGAVLLGTILSYYLPAARAA